MKQTLSHLFAKIPNLGVAGSSPAWRAIATRSRMFLGLFSKDIDVPRTTR